MKEGENEKSKKAAKKERKKGKMRTKKGKREGRKKGRKVKQPSFFCSTCKTKLSSNFSNVSLTLLNISSVLCVTKNFLKFTNEFISLFEIFIQTSYFRFVYPINYSHLRQCPEVCILNRMMLNLAFYRYKLFSIFLEIGSFIKKVPN
jgi:hypothetical protein